MEGTTSVLNKSQSCSSNHKEDRQSFDNFPTSLRLVKCDLDSEVPQKVDTANSTIINYVKGKIQCESRAQSPAQSEQNRKDSKKSNKSVDSNSQHCSNSLDDISDMNEDLNNNEMNGQLDEMMMVQILGTSKSSTSDKERQEEKQRPKLNTNRLDEVSESSESDIKESSTNPESKETDEEKQKKPKLSKNYLAKLYESLPKALDIKRVETDGDDLVASQEKRFKAQIKAMDGALEKKQQDALDRVKKERQNRKKKKKLGLQLNASDSDDVDTSSEDFVTDSSDEPPQDDQDEIPGFRDVVQKYDGWKMYRRRNVAQGPVRRYCHLIDADYKRNKVTVCAHLSNIFNSYVVKRGRPIPAGQTNYFDMERWTAYQVLARQIKQEKKKNKLKQNEGSKGSSSPSKVQGSGFNQKGSMISLTGNEQNLMFSNQQSQILLTDKQIPKTQMLLTKTASTGCIPLQNRGREGKRIYSNYDKEVAHKMFGYRIGFKEEKQIIEDPEDDCSQLHKPLHRFMMVVLQDLTKGYTAFPKFETKQKVQLIPTEDKEEIREEGEQSEEYYSPGQTSNSPSPSTKNSPRNQLNTENLQTQTDDVSLRFGNLRCSEENSPLHVDTQNTHGQNSPRKGDSPIKFITKSLPFVYESKDQSGDNKSAKPRKFFGCASKQVSYSASKNSTTQFTTPRKTRQLKIGRKLSGAHLETENSSYGKEIQAQTTTNQNNNYGGTMPQRLNLGSYGRAGSSLRTPAKRIAPEKHITTPSATKEALQNPYNFYQVRYEAASGNGGFAQAIQTAQTNIQKKSSQVAIQGSTKYNGFSSTNYNQTSTQIIPNHQKQQSMCNLLHMGGSTQTKTRPPHETPVTGMYPQSNLRLLNQPEESEVPKKTYSRPHVEQGITPHAIAAAIQQQKQKEKMQRIAASREASKRLNSGKGTKPAVFSHSRHTTIVTQNNILVENSQNDCHEERKQLDQGQKVSVQRKSGFGSYVAEEACRFLSNDQSTVQSMNQTKTNLWHIDQDLQNNKPGERLAQVDYTGQIQGKISPEKNSQYQTQNQANLTFQSQNLNLKNFSANKNDSLYQTQSPPQKNPFNQTDFPKDQKWMNQSQFVSQQQEMVQNVKQKSMKFPLALECGIPLTTFQHQNSNQHSIQRDQNFNHFQATQNAFNPKSSQKTIKMQSQQAFIQAMMQAQNKNQTFQNVNSHLLHNQVVQHQVQKISQSPTKPKINYAKEQNLQLFTQAQFNVEEQKKEGIIAFKKLKEQSNQVNSKNSTSLDVGDHAVRNFNGKTSSLGVNIKLSPSLSKITPDFQEMQHKQSPQKYQQIDGQKQNKFNQTLNLKHSKTSKQTEKQYPQSVKKNGSASYPNTGLDLLGNMKQQPQSVHQKTQQKQLDNTSWISTQIQKPVTNNSNFIKPSNKQSNTLLNSPRQVVGSTAKMPIHPTELLSVIVQNKQNEKANETPHRYHSSLDKNTEMANLMNKQPQQLLRNQQRASYQPLQSNGHVAQIQLFGNVSQRHDQTMRQDMNQHMRTTKGHSFQPTATSDRVNHFSGPGPCLQYYSKLGDQETALAKYREMNNHAIATRNRTLQQQQGRNGYGINTKLVVEATSKGCTNLYQENKKQYHKQDQLSSTQKK